MMNFFKFTHKLQLICYTSKKEMNVIFKVEHNLA